MPARKSASNVTLFSISALALLLASTAMASADPPGQGGVQFTASTFAPAPATSFGTAGSFLSGPTTVPSTGVWGAAPATTAGNSGPPGPKASSADPPANAFTGRAAPYHNARAGASPLPSTVDPPKPNGAYAVQPNAPGVSTNAFALDAAANQAAFSYTIEPPDQGLCANGQYVMEMLNIGIVQVYDASTLKPVSNGFATLDGLLGLQSQVSTVGPAGTTGWSSSGDVQCLYDPSNGGHWFIIEIVSTSPEAPVTSSGQPGPFQGCFVAAPDSCREGVAVSTTSDPMGSYNVYFLDPNSVNSDPGASAQVLLNDYAKIGTTADALMLFYDEFNLGTTLPTSGYGSLGFNGAQEFAFSKAALESGVAASGVNVAYENMGTAPNLNPVPADPPFQPTTAGCDGGVVCWYQVIPAQTPDASQFDSSNGGTGWMAASLDFYLVGDNRVATFDWTGLCALDGSCSAPGTQVMFGGTLYTTPQLAYSDGGQPCLVQYGGLCGLAPQKAGPTPLGDLCGSAGLSLYSASCPESGLGTNGDGATQASYADGNLWTAVSTTITQTSPGRSQLLIGAAYWGVSTSTGTVSHGGYVSASNEDLEFPAMAATDGGAALMSFTLSGPDYYPSSAYTWVATPQGGPRGPASTIFVTAMGQSPQDGFTGYLGWPGQTRPRWGDYGAAVFVPGTAPSHHGGPGGQSTAGTVYFTSEYIQYPNCSDQAFISGITANGLTCGGTRSVLANWGTSINSLSSP